MQRIFYDHCRQNENLIALVGKADDPSTFVLSLWSHLEATTTKNDKIFTSTQNYVTSDDDKASEFQELRASIRFRVSLLIASSQKSSQRKHEYVIAKMKRDEIEKQNEAAILFVKIK